MVRPSWEPKVTFGNLLTVVTMLGALAAVWMKAESRTVALEVRQSAADKRVDRFEEDIVKRLERIENKIDRRSN
jgi:hypothetical protein